MLQRALCAMVVFFSVFTCAAQTDTMDQFSDPWEPMNRQFWYFNYHVLDKPIYRPASHFYADYVPFGVREALNNALRNLEEPSSFLNHLLQGKFKRANNNLIRFLFNSTLGLAGLVDIMGHAGETRDLEEFGDVMGFYGVPEGPYVMLPIFGPTTLRKEVGDLVDMFTSPIGSSSWGERFAKWGADGLYKRAAIIEQEPLLDNSLDSYTFVKDAYLQYRLYRFYNGKPPTPNQDEIDAALDEYLDEIEGY